MHTNSEPFQKDIVLVGGGHSHLYVLKKFGMKPQPGMRITLISRDLVTPYSGMVPGLIAQNYKKDESLIDLRKLSNFAGSRFIHASATNIDLSKGLISLDGRPDVRFDILSLDTGSVPKSSDISGAENALPVKPINLFLKEQAKINKEITDKPGDYNIVIIGGGAGGVELGLSLDQQLRRSNHSLIERPEKLSIFIIEGFGTLLPNFNKAARKKIINIINKRRITAITNSKIDQINTDTVTLSDGKILPADRTILVTNAEAPSWLSNTGLALDRNGFIRIDQNLRSVSHPMVYATGDIASLENYDLPKSGVYAVRQGPYLAENLRRAAIERPLKKYKPQKQTLALITTGDGGAIAARGSVMLSGKWVWHWKDWIDRRWIEQYRDLPQMSATNKSDNEDNILEEMRCGGCGAKVASPILHQALDRLPAQTKQGLEQGLESPDDAAVIIPPSGKALIQSVDQFRSFIDDPYIFAQIASNHCLGDIFAMGAKPHSALAAILLPHNNENIISDDLYQLLLGATKTLNEADAVLAGGHTGEGAEMAFGLTVNGYVDPEKIMRKGALKPRDLLILTKPLGTGILFAGDMLGKSRGEWIEQAISSMQRSLGPLVPILQKYRVEACTDVTGFGLLGHLVEMLNASKVSASLNLNSLPLLEGVTELSRQGIESSLKEDNQNAMADYHKPAVHPTYPILFDPQTAGGLLFSVSEDFAQECVVELNKTSAPGATIIGSVNEIRGTMPSLVFE
jgi:selenide,water dikinase